MSYLPPGLVDLDSDFAGEEEDVLRIHMDPRGRSSDITLLHRYVSHASQTDTSYESVGIDGLSRPRRTTPRILPQPHQFQTIDDPSSLDSPYFRKCSLRRRRSLTDQTAEPEAGFSRAQNDSPQDLEEIDVENVKQSTSSESQALYGTENVVKELKPDYVRWFYKYDQDRKWTPFTGYDSIRMEMRYRNLVLEKEEDQNREFTNGYNQYGTSNNLPDDPTRYYANNGKPTTGTANSSLINSSNSTASPSRLTNIMSKTWNRAWNPSTKTDGSPINSLTNGYNDNPATIAAGINGTNGQGQSSGYSFRSTDLENSLDDCNENIIIVRGGLYEADLESWNCVATYWPGDKCQITRGTWFYDGTWQPLSVDHAEKLEEEHLGQFSGVSLALYPSTTTLPDSPTKKSRPVIHRVSFCEFHVDWTSPTDIHLFSKAASYKFMRSVGQRLGFQTWGHRVCRGYLKPASIVDRPSEISHVVFVVHGIGQKMDTGRIVRNCASFRETVASLKDKFFPQLNEAKQRAEFFPVEWRSAAKLDGDVVEAITPHKLLSLRQLLNATAMDIMYYTSPLYRSEIQNALRNELNRIYSNFVKRNPDFRSRGGKVSVIAHSLGAVITYDIVTGYMPGGPEPPLPLGMCNQNHQPHQGGHASMNDGSMHPQVPEHYPGLLFQLEHFFCLGSPLSVFLALRWREPFNPDYRSLILPQMLCKRIYNVFYPTDPVAYRLEPLLNKNYVHIAPLPVHCYGSSSRTKYEDMPRERINKEYNFTRSENPTMFSTQGQEPSSSAKSTPQRSFSLKSPPTPTKESNWGWSSIMKYLKSSDNGGLTGGVLNDGEIGGELISPDGNSSPNRDEGNSTPEDVGNEIPNDLDYRMDYVLKESNFSSTYLAALTSHTSYWSSPDTAFFVLTHLYGGVLDPNPQAQ